MTDLKLAAARAADWLEANPTKHVARSLAIDADGNKVAPDDPTAECFCALGRLAVELGLEFPNPDVYYAFPKSVPLDDIWEANDKGSPTQFETGSRRITPANPAAGIAALRSLAQ